MKGLGKFLWESPNYSLCLAHDINKFLIDDLNHFERFLAGDGINENVPMKVHGVLRWKDAVFVLTSSIYQLNFIIGIIDSRNFAKCYGDKRKQQQLLSVIINSCPSQNKQLNSLASAMDGVKR